jgi:hypothetical protein
MTSRTKREKTDERKKEATPKTMVNEILVALLDADVLMAAMKVGGWQLSLVQC